MTFKNVYHYATEHCAGADIMFMNMKLFSGIE